MKYTLDKLDLRILSFLQPEARITNQALADKVGLSPSSCLQRVKRLETHGILQGYLGQVNLGKICRYVTCIASVVMRNHSPRDFDEFITCVDKIPEVIECFTVSGEYDFVLKIVCSDMTKHLELNNQLLLSNEKIESINTHVVMKNNKPFKGYPIQLLNE